MSRKEPTIAAILRELSDRYDGIVAEREVFDQVLARRPSSAKDPYASIREQLRFGAVRVGWVALGGGELVPLRVVLQGLRFRLVPSDDELNGRMLIRAALRPFVPYIANQVRFEDAQGQPLTAPDTTLALGEGIFGPVSIPAFDLRAWFEQNEFALGDSILVTVAQTEPMTLRLVREPAAAFDAAAVAAQEREIVDALAARVARAGRNQLVCEDCVLPIYARAAWRTAYPGRPWQQLVVEDRRLRLLDGDYVADSSFRRPLDMLFGDERTNQDWEESDQAILDAIGELQNGLRTSRREAADRGLWNGIAPRVSTARTIFDMHQGTAETFYPGAVNALEDHSADIEEHITRGDYADQGWVDDDDDDFGMVLDDDFELDEDMLDIDEIDDVHAFVEQNPALGEATRRLMESLTPEELEQLQQAETLDDVQRVLASHLNDMLRNEPSLFVPLPPPQIESINGNGHVNGNGHTNGNGHGHINGDTYYGLNEEPPFDEEYDDDEDDLIDTDDLDDDDDEEEEEDEEEDQIQVEMALERSNEQMEQFYQHQIGSGKSETTAASRTRDLWIYADFLGNFYGRSLEAGDYATLDECLFFFYPRKVMNSSPRAVRDLCTSVKQFYAFLKGQKQIDDDAFAVAIWQRRDQAARVVELYEQIDGDSPQFERLFAHLFAPYTA